MYEQLEFLVMINWSLVTQKGSGSAKGIGSGFGVEMGSGLLSGDGVCI